MLCPGLMILWQIQYSLHILRSYWQKCEQILEKMTLPRNMIWYTINIKRYGRTPILLWNNRACWELEGNERIFRFVIPAMRGMKRLMNGRKYRKWATIDKRAYFIL